MPHNAIFEYYVTRTGGRYCAKSLQNTGQNSSKPYLQLVPTDPRLLLIMSAPQPNPPPVALIVLTVHCQNNYYHCCYYLHFIDRGPQIPPKTLPKHPQNTPRNTPKHPKNVLIILNSHIFIRSLGLFLFCMFAFF